MIISLPGKYDVVLIGVVRYFGSIEDLSIGPSIGCFQLLPKDGAEAFYFIKALTKALTYYYINRSQRHLLAAIEKN